MNSLQKVRLDDVTINLDKIRIPLSSSERAKLAKKYRYYGAQGVIDYVDKFLFDGEYLLVAEDGENLKSQKANVCNYVTGRFWVNNHAHILQAKNDNDLKYIYYLLNLKDFSPYVTGSAQPKLTQDNLASIELLIHKPSDQRKIASVLSSLDSKIELNNRINAELEAMAKTLYNYWFVQFDFPDENGKPYKTSGGKMVWNEALKRAVPEGWEVGALNSFGDIIGGSTPPKEIDEYFSTNGMAWITPKDLSLNGNNKFITKGEVDVSEKGLKAASLKIMPKGTILMSSRAPIGYMAIARNSVTTNQGFKSFVPNTNFSTTFIFYAIKNALPEIINNASGSTFKEISGSTLKLIKICLPGKSIVQKFTNKITAIFERQNLLELENGQLSDLRDWLLPMLMNGQVKVGEAAETLSMAAEPEAGYKKGPALHTPRF